MFFPRYGGDTCMFSTVDELLEMQCVKAFVQPNMRFAMLDDSLISLSDNGHYWVVGKIEHPSLVNLPAHFI